MDRRLLASNGLFADRALEGHIDARNFVVPEERCLIANAWLRRDPEGAVDRECLYGDRFDVIEIRGSHAFGRAGKDGYVGWLPTKALGAPKTPSHWVSVRSTWAYAAPDIKSAPLQPLHMTSRLNVLHASDGWAEIEGGMFAPEAHLSAIGDTLDQIAAARAFLGTPYVWGGNSGFGIDCSGLVQVTAHAAGRVCAADSDLQEAMQGEVLPETATLSAGDLVFWKGHVALASGEGTLIHANAHHMMVVEEPVAGALNRIAATETGPATSRLRPTLQFFA